MSLVFRKTLVRAPHVRSFEINLLPAAGWEVSEREDQRVVQQRRYNDWHRVERAVLRFTRDVSDLRRQGWLDA